MAHERTTDIALPMPPGGKVDPRIAKRTPDVLGAARKAAEGLKTVRSRLSDRDVDRMKRKKATRGRR